MLDPRRAPDKVSSGGQSVRISEAVSTVAVGDDT